MAKDNPNSAAVQYKVHLKPTEIGRHVMKRMERPHLDKSAELRRFIELGYAAEQAGFILDGAVLRHAGRMWDTQPDLGDKAETETGLTSEKPDSARQRAHAPRSAKPAPEPASPSVGHVEPGLPVEGPDKASSKTAPLRGRLRGLSG